MPNEKSFSSLLKLKKVASKEDLTDYKDITQKNRKLAKGGKSSETL